MSGNYRYRLTYNLSQTYDKRGEARDIYHFKFETFDLSTLEFLEEKSFMITSKSIPEVNDFLIFYRVEPGDMESWDALDILRAINAAAEDSEMLEELVYDKLMYYEYGIHTYYDDITEILGEPLDNNMEQVD